MDIHDYDIGVVGAGAAGLTVASGAAQLGARTLLVEQDAYLGGDCLHFGCVPSKTLIKSARAYHMMKNGPRYGLPAVEVPPVDFTRIAARIRSVIDTIQAHDSEERFCGLGVKVNYGSPAFLDDHTVMLNGRRITAAKWVLTTGSSPEVPSIPGLKETPYITNREIFSLDRLPQSMIVLGAGPIAIEMAQAFRRLGTKVTVVQRSGQILSKEDKDMADMVMDVLEREGVEFRLNTSVQSIANLGSTREVNVTTEDGKMERLTAETILVALGRSSNIDGLNLEAAGVESTRKGITVDARMRTNRPHIYAGGDVTGAWQFTHAAGYEGGIIIANAVFHFPRKADYTFVPWCTYTEPELASIGMNEKAAKAAGIKYEGLMEEFRENDRGLAESEDVGRLKMLLDEKGKPIGVQIFGPHAGELLSEWVAVLSAKVKLSTLAGSVHPYPTLAEINKKVAGDFVSRTLFSDKVKKGLKFFFHLKGRACAGE